MKRLASGEPRPLGRGLDLSWRIPPRRKPLQLPALWI
jgi:hypothetical protein